MIAEDRNEDAVNCDEVDVDIEYARDKDARWLKKGHRYYFDYKGYTREDADGGEWQDYLADEGKNQSELHKETEEE